LNPSFVSQRERIRKNQKESERIKNNQKPWSPEGGQSSAKRLHAFKIEKFNKQGTLAAHSLLNFSILKVSTMVTDASSNKNLVLKESSCKG
jgi:hypothetical protein